MLKDASRALLPAEVIDRTKGYFPVPGIRHLDGEVLDMVRDALTNDAAAGARAVPAGNRRGAAGRAQRDPHHAGRQRVVAVGVLEMWLQSMEG